MPCLIIDDYGAGGWKNGAAASSRTRHYCAELEAGAVLYFQSPPFDLPNRDVDFLLGLKPADSRLHKNISYRPESDLIRGLSNDGSKPRVHQIMRYYASQVRKFVSRISCPLCWSPADGLCELSPSGRRGPESPTSQTKRSIARGRLSQSPYSWCADPACLYQRKSSQRSSLGRWRALPKSG